jgi:hypothetical protein
MKRIALVFAALALTGAMAYAQDAAPAAPAPVVVTIGDWGRQIFQVGGQDSSGYSFGTGTSWDNTPRIVGLNIQAAYANGGFSITPEADNGGFGLTDQNKAWVIPLPGLTFEAGLTLETDTWRGTSDFGSDDWVRFQSYQQNSFTFFRLGEASSNSTFDVNYNKDGIGAWALVSGTGQDIGSSLQAGAAYTVPSVATIKAQYIGYNVGGTTLQGTTRSALVADGTAFGQIQVAVNVSPLVKGLNEEIGVDFPSNATDAGYVFQVSDITDFAIPSTPVTAHLLVLITDFNGNLSTSGGSGYGLLGGVGADYDLGNKVTLNGDVRYGNALGSSNGLNTSNSLTGVLIGIKKGFDHGDIGIGFEYSTSTIIATAISGAGDATKGHWLIPVELTESF